MICFTLKSTHFPEKAEKYDTYLQKSRARKAKARAKAKELRKEFF
jgi:hypothetical protein